MYRTIPTNRLQIRPLKEVDAPFIFKLVNSEGWLNFIGDKEIYTVEDAKNYILKIHNTRDYYYNVFELRASGEPMGIVTLLKRTEYDYPDFGFAILPEFSNRGYTFEASNAYLTEMLKAKTIDKLIAITIPHNVKSINLLKKLGFNYINDHTKENEVLSVYCLNTIKHSD